MRKTVFAAAILSCQSAFAADNTDLSSLAVPSGRPNRLGVMVYTPEEKAAIHKMDILERPQRLGHFYGRGVRWMHGQPLFPGTAVTWGRKERN